MCKVTQEQGRSERESVPATAGEDGAARDRENRRHISGCGTMTSCLAAG